MTRLVLNEVKSMLELRLTAIQIAHRLAISVGNVNLAISMLKSR